MKKFISDELRDDAKEVFLDSYPAEDDVLGWLKLKQDDFFHHHTFKGAIALIEQLQKDLAESEAEITKFTKRAADGLSMSKLDRECLRIGQELQRAAGELPELYTIQIEVENGSGSVVLITPDGEATDIDHGGDGLSYSITDALDAAVSHTKGLHNDVDGDNDCGILKSLTDQHIEKQESEIALLKKQISDLEKVILDHGITLLNQIGLSGTEADALMSKSTYNPISDGDLCNKANSAANSDYGYGEDDPAKINWRKPLLTKIDVL
jgi:hypothetical protein